MKVTSFSYHGTQVRCVYTANEFPWLFVEDVVQCVGGIDITTCRSHLEKKDVQDIVIRTVPDTWFTVVRNNAIYDLVACGDEGEALRFMLWYAAKVLPGIASMLEQAKAKTTAYLLSPTELAPLLGAHSAKQVNTWFRDAGLQILASTSDIGYTWQPTELGRLFGELVDTGLRKRGGSDPIVHLRWREEVVQFLHQTEETRGVTG